MTRYLLTVCLLLMTTTTWANLQLRFWRLDDGYGRVYCNFQCYGEPICEQQRQRCIRENRHEFPLSNFSVWITGFTGEHKTEYQGEPVARYMLKVPPGSFSTDDSKVYINLLDNHSRCVSQPATISTELVVEVYFICSYYEH